ncbi:MAG: PepSY domain-containing protein [Vicinamibacteria bacterium]|jgi:uncharacterized membrane protein YkoI
MTEKIKGVAAALAAVAALAVGGAAIAGASGNGNSSPQQPTASQSSEPAGSQEGTGESQDGNEGPDQAITGSALDQASAAALAHTGGGQVTGTEVGDEQSYYEVEVTRDDGSQVDVQLDRAFHVVSSEADSEG